jgi:hypothetical protein
VRRAEAAVSIAAIAPVAASSGGGECFRQPSVGSNKPDVYSDKPRLCSDEPIACSRKPTSRRANKCQ